MVGLARATILCGAPALWLASWYAIGQPGTDVPLALALAAFACGVFAGVLAVWLADRQESS